ncbi:Helicase and polymerase-containing protein TEBICHI [Camellia lanceoleosa]|uniref:Helicase and polymerase-containing protein TEBICHI n=1 Tax=Camellia lanceoleosa TaxID=1840588 RepID=A0ACC0IR06_9ERIC|nr:Helicase and polymerase-containing protein TEBICHI [Camellia lanceoleosa]
MVKDGVDGGVAEGEGVAGVGEGDDGGFRAAQVAELTGLLEECYVALKITISTVRSSSTRPPTSSTNTAYLTSPSILVNSLLTKWESSSVLFHASMNLGRRVWEAMQAVGPLSTIRHIAKFLRKFPVNNDQSEFFDITSAIDALRKCPAGLDPIFEETLSSGVAYHHLWSNQLQDILPGIINQLGPNNLDNLRKLGGSSKRALVQSLC